MQLGTTFAHPYLRDYFRLPVTAAFNELLSLNFRYIRLGCYWWEAERRAGEYDFGETERLLELAEKKGQAIVLTLGMKAPRHPEFHLPGWTNVHQTIQHPDKLLRYLEETVKRLGSYRSLHYWQVENEPLDLSGPQKLTIPQALLEREVAMVRRLSPKPVVLTLWGNRDLRDARLGYLANLGDRVGADLYYHIPNGHGGTWGPANSDEELRQIFAPFRAKTWIMELQTNPWKDAANLSHQDILESNLKHGLNLGPETVFLWGAEYWLALKAKGQGQIWDQIRKRVPTK